MPRVSVWVQSMNTAPGRVRFGVINEGDMDKCPSQRPKPAYCKDAPR